MSDESHADKTEEPTPKKLQDARDKGQVATSQEVNSWVMLTTGTVIIVALVPSMAGGLADLFTPFLAAPHAIPTDFEHLRQMFFGMVGEIALLFAAAAIMIVIAAGAAGFLQHGPVFSADSLKPDISKISLIKGFQRLFSLKSVMEFVKGVVKLAIVTAIVLIVLLPLLEPLNLMIAMEPGQFVDQLYELALILLAAVLAAMGAIAVVDFIYQKYEFTKRQRMSRREVKEEHKQMEGDPHVKARLKQIRVERARMRMMAAVPQADVVVTNPTHYACALKYDQDETEAPVLVAKGADLIAFQIRTIAEENDVPIVENPPLARALHDTVEVDQMIPVEHYQAVAEIISYVWRLKGKLRPRRQPAGQPGYGPQAS